MTLMKIDLGNEADFKGKLKNFENAASKIPSTWKSSHFGLLIKARAKRTFLSSNAGDTLDPLMDKAEVDKIFRDKEKECGHMKDRKVKPLQFDLIMNYMRANRSSMSVHSLHRIITEFCQDSSDDFCMQRSEAWTFMMEHLEERPPLNMESRIFWMELVSFPKCQMNRCDDLVKAFSQSCLIKLMRYEDVSYEHQLFLLEMLEWDFAAILSNYDSSPNNVLAKHKLVNRAMRMKIDLTDMSNLEFVPLAFLLMCSIKKGDLLENSVDQEHLFERIGSSFDRAADLEHKQLYARLIGLLFDVHLFVCNKDMYFSVFSLEDLPTSYRDYMRRVRIQLVDSKKELKSLSKFSLFAGLLNVKWCADLILSLVEA